MEKRKPVFEGEIWVKNDKIAYVASKEELESELGTDFPKIEWDYEMDCGGNLLMPGFKNAHTHSAMTFLRSMADDLPLDQWLNDKVFPAEKKLKSEDIYELTRLAVLEYLSSGITSICDMYIDPEAVADACIDMGMRCVLVSGLNDFTSSPEEMERQYLELNKKHPLISYQLGFHSEYTCSEELIYKVSQLAHKHRAPVYTHLSETEKEVESCKARHGVTPAVYLDNMGIFDFGGGCFHCVHVSEYDMEVFKRGRVHVVTNPSSNLKLASGIAPVAEFDRKKISVAIGTDGPASNNCLDMFREMFLTAALSKVKENDASSLEAMRVLRMATVHGAKALRLQKADTLAKGKLADIILLDLHQPNMQPLQNIENNIVYSGSKSNVLMTMINGKILYRNGEYNISESVESIYAKCNAIADRILNH